MIETRDVRVDYDGVTAVEDLTLRIPAGEIFGLIGPNGAGKTSTIRVMATLQSPTYGDVLIDGVDTAVDPARARHALGYMPDYPPVYDELKCWEFLDLFGAAYRIGRVERRRRIEEALESVDLKSKRNAKSGTLSRGMRQRLLLAKTILHDPSVLLLDEPASGLDPVARIDLRNTLVRLAERGKTILVSSHILSELSTFCGSIGIMERGRLLVSGPIDEIIAAMEGGRRIDITALKPDPETLTSDLREMEGVVSAQATQRGATVEIEGEDSDAAALLARLVGAGAEVTGFVERKMTVEDILLKTGAKETS